MPRRALSLDVKFPALMTGIAVLASVLFVWLGQRELRRVLERSAGQRMSANAQLVATMLSASLPATTAAAGRLASLPEVERVFARPDDPAAVEAARRAVDRQLHDSTWRSVQGVRLDGRVVQLGGVAAPASVADWIARAAREGTLAPTGLTMSPILADSSAPTVALAFAVGGEPEPLLGWIVETRAVQGRGVEQVRALTGSASLIVGQPGEGAWTDLNRIVDGPPEGALDDSIVKFDDSPRGPGIGVARRVAGTPWYVWLQRDREEVLAPLDAFLLRVGPIAVLIAVLSFLVVWRLSRRVTHRVVALTDRVDRMAAEFPSTGSVAAGAPERPQDELDRLERSFDALTARAARQQVVEAQLLQAQKLEAVGRLAGGVAHDFNNVLTVVTNYGEMLRDDFPKDSQQYTDLDQLLRAADRGAKLTRQLLAFSRRQTIQPRVLDLNAVVHDTHGMLRRLIPTAIEIELELAADVGAVLADPIQVEQVLLNLAVNASDAMPTGGTLHIATRRAELDAHDDGAPHDEKRYSVLVVRDNGVGMDRETVARIFEPFFTTKGPGKGTGLGLATVHGIVQQLGGRVWVYSEPFRGTTFKVYIPVATGPEPRRSGEQAAARRAAGEGLVFVVEDDEATRAVTARLLASEGFTVKALPDASAALAALETGPLPRAVVTDLMMPGFDGAELARRVHKRWPRLPVILTSGYTDARTGELGPGITVILEKPFTGRSLRAAIDEALGSVAGG